MPSKTLFLFDVDGTLVSTEGAGLRALSRAFLDLYHLSDVLSFLNPSGKTDTAIFREIIQTLLKRDMNGQDLEKLIPSYLSFLEDEITTKKTVTVFPGVQDTLEWLSHQPNVVMGLGTGNIEKGARIKLGPTGLNSFFDFGGFGSDSEVRAELLEAGRKKAEEKTGEKISIDNVFIIGDTHLDIKAARKAGFKAIAVATGRQNEVDLAQEEPHAVFSNLEAASGFFRNLIPAAGGV